MIKSNKAFIRAGASLLLLKPESKAPVDDEWTEKPVATYEQLERRCKDHNVGVRLGQWSKIGGFFLHVLDVDIRNDDFEDEARAKLADILLGYDYMAFPRVKSGSGGASFHLYFVSDKPFRSKKLAHSEGFSYVYDRNKRKDVKKWDWEIELFGTGKQVAIPPSIHPDTGNPYRWEIEFDPTADYPLVESTDIEVLVRDEETSPGSDEITNISVEDAKGYIDGLDPDYWCEDREGWIKLGMALHHEFKGGDEGFTLWCDFARRSEKFDLREHKSQWRSFKNRGARPTTFRTVIEASQENVWAATYDELPDMFDDIEDDAEGDVDPDRLPIPKNIADEFDDLPPLDGKPAKVKVEIRRKGDPDLSILKESEIPAPKFPIDVFSKRLQKIIVDGAIGSGAPEDFVISALLAGVAMCIGNTTEVQIKPRYVQPSIIWCMNVGEPSTNKSPALGVVTRALERINNRRLGPYQIALKQWKNECAKADIAMKEWQGQLKARIAAGEDMSAEPPANCVKPEKPARPLIFTNDVTIEAFYRRQAANKRGFGVIRDELASWMAGMERYSGATERASWLEAYEGRSHTIERVKDEGEITFIPRLLAPVIGGIQPDKAQELTSLESADDGLQARFLVFWPDAVVRSMKDIAPDTDDLDPIMARLNDIPLDLDENGHPVPFRMKFTSKAFATYHDWSDGFKHRAQFYDRRLKGVFGKANGQVARLAMFVEMVEWACDDFNDNEAPATVSEKSVKAAIRMYEEYFRVMHLRVFAHATELVEVKNARAIANHIIANNLEIVNLSKIRREAGIRGLNSRTDVEVVEKAIAVLIDKNWLTPMDQEKTPRGGRPKKEFRVNRRIWDQIDAGK